MKAEEAFGGVENPVTLSVRRDTAPGVKGASYLALALIVINGASACLVVYWYSPGPAAGGPQRLDVGEIPVSILGS